MIIFEGNDAWLTTEHIMESLREIAEDDAKEGEYNRAEHTCWIAADIIGTLVKMVNDEAPEVMLRRLAERLETIEFFNKEEWVKRENT